MRIPLFSVFIFFLPSLPAYSATELRTALVIGNGDYSTGSLRNPVNDADDMAAALKRLGFNVTLRKNASQQDNVAPRAGAWIETLGRSAFHRIITQLIPSWAATCSLVTGARKSGLISRQTAPSFR